MDAAALQDFDRALLELDIALRPMTGHPRVTGRAAVIRGAHRALLCTVAPYRMQIALERHQAAGEGRSAAGKDHALELLAKCLDLVEQSGASRTEIVAVVNRETIVHAHE